MNDPYVARAKRDGLRSRAAYKIIEIDDKLKLLQPGVRVVDLGAAPGGWTQVAVDRVNALGREGRATGFVLGVDLQEMEAIAGATLMQLDFLDVDADVQVREALGGPADVVLSDLAPFTTGHKQTDHLRIIAAAEAAAAFAIDVLKPGGAFVAKVLQGGAERDLLTMLKQRFAKVAHIKPPASRSDSAETYVAATGFRPAADGAEDEA